MTGDPSGAIVPNRRIKVTQEDIDKAEPRDQWNCAIAETIKRTTPTARRISVTRERIAWTIGEERFRYPTPEAAIAEIIRPLDTGRGTPKPMVIELVSGTVGPVQHRDGQEQDKHTAEHRDYTKAIRTGTREEPPSYQARRGAAITGNSRTWNRFAAEAKKEEKEEGEARDHE
jgi:hypothetical protein